MFAVRLIAASLHAVIILFLQNILPEQYKSPAHIGNTLVIHMTAGTARLALVRP